MNLNLKGVKSFTMERNSFVKTYLNKIKNLCDKIDIEGIIRIIEVLEEKLKKGRTIFVAGNGGSAAAASHMVCDLGKTVLGKDISTPKKRFRVICLSDNISLLTALANDVSYKVIFSEPLKNFGKKGDLLLAITGSGNSENILEVMKTAKKMQLDTVAFLGFDGGKVKRMADDYIVVPSDEYGPIEDLHMILNHLITAYFKHKNEKKSCIS